MELFWQKQRLVHTDGYICVESKVKEYFLSIIQVVLFKSKSPFCNWAWIFKEFELVLFSVSFRVCYNKDILIFQVANQTYPLTFLWSRGWHNFQSFFWFFVFWMKDSVRITASFGMDFGFASFNNWIIIVFLWCSLAGSRIPHKNFNFWVQT